jgi:hypothetical protein
MLISIPHSQARTRRGENKPDPPPTTVTRPRCPFAARDYAELQETPELSPSREVLEGITRLNDWDTGVEYGVLYRGFTENGNDVI